MSERPFAQRQTPEPGEIFLDHVGWYVPDIDQAGAAFERLGFTLTPFTPHTHESASGERTRSGTANRCAMIELGYLEILCAVPDLDTPLTAELQIRHFFCESSFFFLIKSQIPCNLFVFHYYFCSNYYDS